MTRRTLRRTTAALFVFVVAGCDQIMPQREDLTLPSAESVAAVYQRHGIDANVTLSGNVVEIRVFQPAAQLTRGGSLWARVGPYIYTFSPATREVFDTWAGVSAVRAITSNAADGAEVARALLTRDQLNDITWRRALNVLGTALQEGTRRPAALEALVAWGEANTEYEYHPDYAPDQNRR